MNGRTHCHVNPQLHEKLIHTLRQRGDPHWVPDLCRCLPRIIDLVSEDPCRPVSEQRAVIRSIVMDQCLGSELALTNSSEEVWQLEREVDLLVEQLEKLRHIELRTGEWSQAPVPPQMFG